MNPRRSLFLTHENFLTQVALQYHLEARVDINDEEDPFLAVLTDSAIAECTELLDSDKFYDC